MSQNMLAAYNSGDYESWSRDWSQTMKRAISEDAFEAFRTETIAQTGEFEEIVSITSRPGDNPGVTRWESRARFENGEWILMIAFNDGSKLIEGANLSPAE